MPGVPLETIRKIRGDIQKLLDSDEPLTPLQRAQRDAIRTAFTPIDDRIHEAAKAEPLTDAGRAEWAAVDAAAQEEIQKELIDVRVALMQLLRPGPTDPNSVMYRAHANNFCVYGLFCYSIFVAIVFLCWSLCLWHQGTKQDQQAKAPLSVSELRKKSQELLQASKNAQDKQREAFELRAEADRLQQVLVEQDRKTAAAPPEKAGNQKAATEKAAATNATTAQPAAEKAAAEKASADKLATQRQEAAAAESKAAAAEVAAEEAEARMNVYAATAGHALSREVGPAEWRVLMIVILLGATGGSLRMLTSLVRYVGNAEFYRSWCLYYVAMPIVGAVLAPIVYMLLRVGVLAPGLAGESDTANLNLTSIYMFAALTGLFANQAMVKLRDIFEEIFRTRGKEDKDALSANSPSQPAANTAN